MSRLATPAFAVLLSAMMLNTVKAQEPHQEWMRYLKGEWTSESAELGEGESKVTLGAKGNALVIRGKEEDGDTSIVLMGWRSGTEALVGSGYGSQGNYWHVEYTKISTDSMSGEIHGVVDGIAFKGTATRKRVDDDHQEIHLKATASGEEFTIAMKLARKK